MNMEELSTGQTVKYLYKSGGKDRIIDVRVIGFNGSKIGIEFHHPDAGYLHRRWLHSPKERARLSETDVFPQLRRGAPEGNTNAKKDGAVRVPVALSIGNDRRKWAVSELHKQGVTDPTTQQIARFIKDYCYGKIDSEIDDAED